MLSRSRRLTGIPEGAESKLLRALFAFLSSDPMISGPDSFRPWILVDLPDDAKFSSYGRWSAVVQPLGLDWKDKPTFQQDVNLNVGLSFFLPYEEKTEDTELLSLKLGRYLAGKIYGKKTFQDPDADPEVPRPMNFATSWMKPLMPVKMKDDGGRILTWSVELFTTVDPRTGRFI